VSRPSSPRRGASRWYPARWRARYGPELDAMLEDTYGEGPLPWREQLGLLRAGLLERLREGGLVGAAPSPDERVRSASLLTLWAWSLLCVGGAGFAKFAEHWSAVTPAADRTVPRAAYDAVYVAGVLGATLVIVAALVAAPALVRLVRREGWGGVRRPLIAASAASGLALVSTIALAAWSDRAGSTSPTLLHAAGVAWALLLVAALVTITGAATRVVARLGLSIAALRVLARLTMATSGVIALTTAGILTWWVELALHAPWFFGGDVVGASGPASPPALILIAAVATLATATGLYGASRIVGTRLLGRSR
jgi:hypothetical protein